MSGHLRRKTPDISEQHRPGPRPGARPPSNSRCHEEPARRSHSRYTLPGFTLPGAEAGAAGGLVVIAGLVCTLSFALLLSALGSSGAGVVLTLRNTSIAFARVLAALQGERLGHRQLSGAALVAVGAVLLGVPGGE